MNILPKKRWHVRTKENIARVRKDEAEAAEKERQERLRIEIANKEARLHVLKQKSKQKLQDLDVKLCEKDPTVAKPDHINLFEDLEHSVSTTNKDHDLEAKEKKEEYEKKIGYLTYLGQDTNEAQKKKNWYEVPPESSRYARSTEIKDTYEKLVLKDPDGKPKEKELDIKNGEVCWKAKQKLDPMNAFKSFCSQNKANNESSAKEASSKNSNQILSKLKRKNNNINEKEEKLKKLREARLKREQQEKYRTEMFLKKLGGAESPIDEQPKLPKVTPKYNSQFNPELARQNYR
ncbi:PREDICTED: leukocyte receptor cluster member 1 homolog [Papilio xuthus]|uniref:Leukocyte receptor cluster member 1 homolog n=1 Tax=Papilio xuthus TaxID=66420 RepID=A0AAJ7ECZ9_PAPXU|nr:PREDICTED: leukocyte receptor cluster member 1 homolog [Papilio xuthus]